MQQKFKIKQLTPIIHFQHEQKGATLRASEFKPKLDKYIRKKYNLPEEKHLKYQMKIMTSGNYDEYELPKNNRLYFGNQGNVKHKKAITYPEGLELTINPYFDKNLFKQIKACLPICLAHENFGTRQNKGFGSFYIENDSNYNFDSIENVLKNSDRPVYYFDFIGDDPFKYISGLYNVMKPGINFRRDYQKSLLWKYFVEEIKYCEAKKIKQPIVWEKRFMKMKLSNQEDYGHEQFFIRVLLGLAGNYLFANKKGCRMDSAYHNKESTIDLWRNTFKVSNKEIERFKSPITFKPYKNKIYIILNQDTYEHNSTKILSSKFYFEYGRGGGGELDVPKEFILENFMDYVCGVVNNKEFDKTFSDSDRIFSKMQIKKLTNGDHI